MKAGVGQVPAGSANDHAAQIVLAEIRLLRDLGRSDRQIAGVLERQRVGHPTGQVRWRPDMVQRVLDDQAECGYKTAG